MPMSQKEEHEHHVPCQKIFGMSPGEKRQVTICGTHEKKRVSSFHQVWIERGKQEDYDKTNDDAYSSHINRV
jgi:hypothetical protein